MGLPLFFIKPMIMCYENIDDLSSEFKCDYNKQILKNYKYRLKNESSSNLVFDFELWQKDDYIAFC
jgi:hypothetical protein